jgi:hypothetical protein
VGDVADTGFYAYAVARNLDPGVLGGVTGVRGAAVTVVSHRGLDAVVSEVPLTEFDEQALKRNLEDLQWLEAVARAHDDVVWATAASAPTAPMRLATIFHDGDAVCRRLEDLEASLTHVLDRVEGRSEWSVKVIAPPAPPAASATAGSTTGAEFLRRRKAEAGEREKRHDEGVRAAEQVHEELRALAEDSRLLQPQDPQLTGLDGTMALNAAYLVKHDDGAAFAERVQALDERQAGVSVVLAGPWPPYSFAVLEEES